MSPCHILSESRGGGVGSTSLTDGQMDKVIVEGQSFVYNRKYLIDKNGPISLQFKHSNSVVRAL